jgi:hypothetical protein
LWLQYKEQVTVNWELGMPSVGLDYLRELWSWFGGGSMLIIELGN